MKTLNINNYNYSMGILIDVRNRLDYLKHHHKDAINIYYEKLMYNPPNYLDKSKKYYIMCEKGVLSDKTVRYLNFLGYDVTKIIN